MIQPVTPSSGENDFFLLLCLPWQSAGGIAILLEKTHMAPEL